MTKRQKEIIQFRMTDDEIVKYYGKIENVKTLNIDDLNLDNLKKLKDIHGAYELLKKSKDYFVILSVDIDCDGLTSGYIGYRILKDILGFKVRVVIGTRTAGRGINDYVTKKILEATRGNSKVLLITADHGSNDIASYYKLKELIKDLRIIVTDHHNTYSDDDVIDVKVNNHQEGSNYDNKVCGCGTLFLVLLYYIKMHNMPSNRLDKFLPYVAISTMTDRVSLLSPVNRYFVTRGIKIMNTTPDENIKHMFRVLKIRGKISYSDLSFTIGPFLNTANRLGIEEITLQALLTTNPKRKEALYDYLDEMNAVRKKEVNHVYNTLDYNDINAEDKVHLIEIASEHQVAGIIASGLNEQLNKPVICVSSTGDSYVGSCRATGVNILTTLKDIQKEHPGVIRKCEGHDSACGIVIEPLMLERLQELLNEVVIRSNYSKPYVEYKLKHSDINMGLMNELLEVGPYGMDWPEVLFRVNKVKVLSFARVDTLKFVSLELKDGNKIHAMTKCYTKLEHDAYYDILCHLVYNSNSKREWVSLKIIEFKEA